MVPPNAVPGEAPPNSQGSHWWPEASPEAGARGGGDNGWGAPTSAGPATANEVAGNGLARPEYANWAAPQGAPVPHYPAPGGHRGNGHRPQRSQVEQKPPGVIRRAWQRIVAALAAAGAFLLKFGALLLKLKYVTLVLSMFVSVLAYTLFFGWTFALGFVLLIFVHEMGHVVVLKRQGIPASLPMFIPFLGAFVNMRAAPRSAYQEALSGLAGPYFGVAGAVVVGFWGHAMGSNFLLQLAAVGFLINLFNLMPMLPLDGGRAVAALHPAIWFVGLVGILAFGIYFESPIAFLILVLGGFELWRRWTRRNSPASVAYFSLKPQQRLTVGALYVFVIAVAIVGMQLTYVSRGVSF